MATRRMFSMKIVDSDAFMDMIQTAQLLYFHLSMRADDDGFIGNPKKIMRMIGSGEDDMKILLVKRFLLPFESGIVVIKHWKIHNYIQNDRYTPTQYIEEKDKLGVKENGAYTECIQNVSILDTQVRLELGKDREGKVNKKFIKPTLEQITAYCIERKNSVDPQKFLNYYESKGWLVGKSPMKDWKAAVRTWEGNGYSNKPTNSTPIKKDKYSTL